MNEPSIFPEANSVLAANKPCEQGQAASSNEPKQPTMTLLVYSDTYDKVGMAYSMALTAAAMGWKVNMFFAFWGISAARVKINYRQKSLINVAITYLTGKTLKNLSISRFNMLGLGKHVFRLMGPDKTLPDCYALATEAAANPLIKLTACSATVRMMGVQPQEMLQGIQEGGMVAFLSNAAHSDVSYIL